MSNENKYEQLEIGTVHFHPKTKGMFYVLVDPESGKSTTLLKKAVEGMSPELHKMIKDDLESQ